MSRTTTPSLVVAVAVLVAGVVATLALTLWEPGASDEPVERLSPDGAGAVVAPEPDEPAPEPDLVDRQVQRPPPTDGSLRTTVVWPLEVELDLVRPASLPAAPAGPQPGSGRTARLAGRIADAGGQPVRATVAFTDGANAGRVLVCDALGRFGANDLYPGMAIVEVTGPGILGSRREVRLREGKEELLNIGYGRPGTVHGRVVGEDGEGVAEARVRLDGLETTTDEDGVFFYPEVAAGRCLLEVDRAGFVAYRTILGVASAYTIERDDLQVVLRRPCTLRIVLRPDIGGPGPAQAYLMPAFSNRERRFPWHTVNPVEVSGAAPTVVQDLPEGPLHVRVYRPGAVAVPEYRQVYLNPGQETRAEIRLEPAPVVAGVVLGPDGAVADARVSLTAADAARASQRHFTTTDDLWLDHVLPLMPAARQEVLADRSGRFRLTSWSNLAPFRLLEVTSPDGRYGLQRLLGPEHDGERLELVLEPLDAGDARLVVRLPDRSQALAVRVTVDGAPRDEQVLPPDRDLSVERLVPGTYALEASWYGERVARVAELEIVDLTALAWELPEGAIVGQPEEVWRKLGRAYPGEGGGDATEGSGAAGGE